MSESAPTSLPAGETVARFLAELDGAWSLLRLYGSEHPAFQKAAQGAAGAVDRAVQVSISPKGFASGNAPVVDANLLPLSQRLRSMGLVGLGVEPGLTAAHVVALAQILHEADRGRGTTDALVEKITTATEGRVKAVPLRLAGLHLVEGTGQSAGKDDETAVWRDLFSGACFGGAGGTDSAGLAAAFETALRGVQSADHWNAMIGVWTRQLSAIDPSQASADPTPGSAENNSTRPLDAVASFMGALSPLLCQRLLAETIGGRTAPEPVVLALADRLPAGVVLGALSAVDRTNLAPSSAALSLLRKISLEVSSQKAPQQTVPETNAELAEIASSLERLLGSKHEGAFVPDEYLRRRHELSSGSLAPARGPGVNYPSAGETRHRAAELAFQIVAAPDAKSADLASCLEFLRQRLGDWIRAGEFSLAAQAMALAKGLGGHEDHSVSGPARAIRSGITVEDLRTGLNHRASPHGAVDDVAGLLREADGDALAQILSSVPAASGATRGHQDPVLGALRKVLPVLEDEAARSLFKAIGDTVPPALMTIVHALPESEAIKVMELVAPHAEPAPRRAVVQAIFRRDFKWPLPLIEQLLKDDEPEIRRQAVMKLVRDADLATAARIFQAATRGDEYEPDVALGLGELLHRHRHHAEVRTAWRQWTWSRRRWGAFLSFSLGNGRRAG